ncbi:hypothetical protein YYC_00069 [Plasmodium yoelii 17X]|uniref:BIR protein n=1 Tax=Plasmodium yoelii 17X TaxID=1323249 RepID=V7PVR9_PLAYE|nr:hypothetical protein YYC_00069 [Plasmodium yoelii 17X]
MDDDICGKFDLLRKYFSDNLEDPSPAFFNDFNSLNKYCPNNYCNTDLDKTIAGFLWLLEQNCSISNKKTSDNDCINAFFLYIISWLSYKLNQIPGHHFTTINDFYTKHVNNNQNYTSLINDTSKCTKLKEIIDNRKDLLNINIEDMSIFYDGFKLLCNMHGNLAMGNCDEKLSNNAIHFFNKYTDINDYYNVEGTTHSQILSTLATDYNKLKTKCINDSIKFPSLPTERATKSFLRNSSIKISVIPMVFIFFGLLIYLGIVYKENDSKTQFKNQKNKEENKSLTCDSKSSDYFRNSNNY